MSKYVQVTAPDMQKLGELTLISKGRGRTMEEYSYDTGIDEDTLFSIISAEIAEPLEPDMLETISDLALDLDLYLDLMLVANGMVDEDRLNDSENNLSRYMQWMMRADENGLTDIRHAKNAITAELLRSKICVKTIPANQKPKNGRDPFGIELRFDFDYHIDNARYPFWFLKVFTDRDSMSYVMSQANKLFSWGSQHSDLLAGTKASFVFTDPKMFADFCDRCLHVPIKNAVSAILVDAETETVSEENWLTDSNDVPEECVFNAESPATRYKKGFIAVRINEYPDDEYENADFDTGDMTE